LEQLEIYEILISRIKVGELSFSSGSRMALKLRKTLDDPDCSIETASKLIQLEPLLAARVVATANSVAYNRSGRIITDVKTAISLLGFRTVRTLAMALVAKQMAGDLPSLEHRKIADQLWEHTAHVSSLAQVIARRVIHQDPEAALFAGIVHEIGGFYLISCAEEFPILLNGDYTHWLERGEAEIGRAILEVIGVPEIVEQSIEGAWEGFLSIPPVSLADALLLAEDLAPIPSPLHRIKRREQINEDAAQIEMMIGDAEQLSEILETSANEVKSLTAALRF
jgi:HD-like signal output (HDOD) protein